MAKPPPRKPKKKVCQFCKDKSAHVDYKDTILLRKFISDRGKIRARRVSGNCSQHQRDVAVAIKTAREVAPLVATLHERAESLRAAELDRVASRLGDLDDRQRAAVEAATRAVVAKLLHEPTVRLKDAAGTARGDRLVESLRDLFDL